MTAHCSASYCVTTSSVTSNDREVPSELPLASVAFPRMVMLVTPIGVTGVVGSGFIFLPWHPIIKAIARPANAKTYRTRTAPRFRAPAVSS